MLGNPKKPVTILFDPEEAVTLCDMYSGSQSIRIAANVWKYWMEAGCKVEDDVQDTLLLLGTIFDAGRLQGIREERARRRKEAHHA